MTPLQIKKLRGSTTQEQFSAELGVSLRTLLRWEAGHVKPSRLALATLRRLADQKGSSRS